MAYHQGYNQPAYGQPANPYAAAQGYAQPNVYVPGTPQPQAQAPGLDPLMQGMANVAATQLMGGGHNYLQKGQNFMKDKINFLSGNTMHYYFNIDSHYVRLKLYMLVAPFLRRWSWLRALEQIQGGHKYQTPKRDENAPDLYIPFVALCTLAILTSISKALHGQFTPDTMYATVSSLWVAWLAHFAAIKTVLYMMGIPSAAPFLEVLAYAGYPFVLVCIASVVGMLTGGWVYFVARMYGGLCMAIFMVRSMKRVTMQDANQYGGTTPRQNYVLLLLAGFQFLYVLYLGVRS